VPFDRGLVYDHQIGILATVRGGLAYTDLPLVQHRVHRGNQMTRLPDPSRRPRDPARRGERRIASRWRERTTLAAHGAFFARRGIDPAFGARDAAGLRRARVEFSRRSFDLALFRLLLRQRRRLLRGAPSPVRRAWSTARSERWYGRSRGSQASTADALVGARGTER